MVLQPFLSQLLSMSENSDSYLIVTYKTPDMQNDADTSPMPTNIIEQRTQQQTNPSDLTSNLKKINNYHETTIITEVIEHSLNSTVITSTSSPFFTM